MSLKAIKMYSDAKYPAYSTYKEYQTLINNPKEVTNKVTSQVDNFSVRCPTESGVRADHYASELKLKEKLQFYYVMNKSLKKDCLDKTNETPVTRVSSVSALLIDDDDDKISKKYTGLSSELGNNSRKIEDAPNSINQPWQSSDFDSPSYLYAPMLGEVSFNKFIFAKIF